MTGLLRERARGWARELRLLVELDELSRRGAAAGVAQFPQLEMAGSWNISQLTASRWQWEASRFTEALPRSFALLSRGRLLEHQAKVLLHRTRHCTVETAQAVEAQVLPAALELCPADLARLVDRTVLRIESESTDPAAAEQRQAAAAAHRRTFTKPLPDGMGLAGAVLTAEQLIGWTAGLDALERRERRADHTTDTDRTVEQRKADLFAALPAMVLAGTAQDRANTTSPSPTAAAGAQNPADPAATEPPTTDAILPDAPNPTAATAVAVAVADTTVARPSVTAVTAGCGLAPWTFGPEQLAAHLVLNVHVPVSTVLDLSREPGSLDRYGPISAEHIRLLRPRSWRRVMVDSHSGRPLAVDDRLTPVADDPHTARQQILAMLTPDVITDVDEPQHDPSSRLARLIHLRDPHCCGPGCSSTRTDNDHLIPHPQGPTSPRNLGRVSRRCHRAKHAGWTLERHPDGSVTWTSPLHRTYHRPSPHTPPPHIDLTTDPPPLRPRPQPEHDPDRHLRPEDLTTPPTPGHSPSQQHSPAAQPHDQKDQPDQDDDPPPF